MTQRPRSPSQVTPRTVWTVGLHSLAMLAVLWMLVMSWTVLSWALVAIFLALAAHPLVSGLEKRGMRRGVAVMGVGLLGLGLLAALVVTLVPMLIDQGRGLAQAAPDFIARLRHHPWVERMDERYDLISQASEELRRHISMAPGPLLGVVTDVLRHLLAGVTIFVLTIFFLLFGSDLFNTALQWVEPSRREHYWRMGRRMNQAVGGYVAGSFFVALIGGVFTSVMTLLLGVPYFLPLGLAMAVLGLVPFVGSFLGGVLVAGTTAASVGGRQGLIALGLFLVYQQVEGNLLQPLVQRRTLKMNPLIIALVMLVGTGLAGLIGALLSLPIAGAIQVWLQDRLTRLNEQWRHQREEDGKSRLILPSPPPGPREDPRPAPAPMNH
ncbi:AI-2E family transporter [Cystobacter fuscus]|uniref:AI-2E family transporter n=1 Tax=Cystobacter fuscus TaxID=43 RepID=UPI0037BE7DF6